MNLHGIVKGAIGAVNPFMAADFYRSGGFGKTSDFKQIPIYYPAVTFQVQIQPFQYNDIAQLDGLNIQGKRRKIYVDGHYDGVVRADQSGGDLLNFPEVPGGPIRTWLVALVFEQFPDWCSLCVTLQDFVSTPTPVTDGQLDFSQSGGANTGWLTVI